MQIQLFNSSSGVHLVEIKPSAYRFSVLDQPGAKMVTASKATVPTIGDQASAMQLSQCAKNLASALAELRTASQKVQLHSLSVLSCEHPVTFN